MVAFAALAAPAGGAAAADPVVAPGGSLTLGGDVVLSGTDSFVAGAAGGARCTIDGATHGLKATEGWTGRVAITGCDVMNLGTVDVPAIDVINADAGAVFDVQDTTFGASGRITVQSFADITFRFLA